MSEFAARLNDLFSYRAGPGQKLVTNDDVVRALTERGQPLSASYLSQLRSGRRENPAPAVVVALAEYFQVRPTYFSGIVETDIHPEDLALLARLHGDGLRALLVHAYHLRTETTDVIVRFAESLRAAEGLMPEDG
ncbi:transcriptional regulator [Nocardia asteroides]